MRMTWRLFGCSGSRSASVGNRTSLSHRWFAAGLTHMGKRQLKPRQSLTPLWH